MRIRSLCVFVLYLLTFANVSVLFSQDQPPISDPKAISLANQAITALTNGTAVSDVTLIGDATWIAGSDKETGAVTLQAKGTGESRIDLTLNGGTRTEVRNDEAGFHQGQSVAPDGTLQAWAEHNCQVNASWFFPVLSVLVSTSDSSLIFTYIGLESWGNGSVQHIRAYRYLSGQKASVISFTESMSTEDIYLDSVSFLPVAFTFNVHPDGDASTNIPLEIDFSNYKTVNGVQIPFHVQRLISGGLALDIVVTSAVVNSGLSDVPFAIQ
jgi:hypothetical protein